MRRGDEVITHRGVSARVAAEKTVRRLSGFEACQVSSSVAASAHTFPSWFIGMNEPIHIDVKVFSHEGGREKEGHSFMEIGKTVAVGPFAEAAIFWREDVLDEVHPTRDRFLVNVLTVVKVESRKVVFGMP